MEYVLEGGRLLLIVTCRATDDLDSKCRGKLIQHYFRHVTLSIRRCVRADALLFFCLRGWGGGGGGGALNA